MNSRLMEDKTEDNQQVRPYAVTALIAATALLTYRAAAILMIGEVDTIGGPPESWFVPMLGDIAVGVGAVVTAMVLWTRPSFGAWLTAVIFHTFAFTDIGQAIINAVRVPYNTSMVGDLMLPTLWFGLLVSIVNIYLLSRSDVRRYYEVNKENSPTPNRP